MMGAQRSEDFQELECGLANHLPFPLAKRGMERVLNQQRIQFSEEGIRRLRSGASIRTTDSLNRSRKATS